MTDRYVRRGNIHVDATMVRRCNVLYLLALIGAVTLAVLLWKAFGPGSRPPMRVTGPDDDPEFLWRVDRDAHRRRTDGGAGPDQDDD